MINSNYLYNNEAIGTVAIASVLRHSKALTYAECLLVLPFLLHDDTLTFLSRSNFTFRSSEELLIKKSSILGNFNSRYTSLLPVSLNALLILDEMGVIEISEKNISYIENNKFDLDAKSLGNRAGRIVKGAEKLNQLFALEKPSSLYLKLRIQL